MNELVYLLCFLTSLACAILLMRGYRSTGGALLLWTAVCFAGLAFNNLMLVVDLVVLKDGPDLSLYRNLVGLASAATLLFNLVWGDFAVTFSVFVSGAFMVTLAFIGVYFLRFYRDTADPFFLYFAAAFGLLAIERFPLMFWQPWDEARSLVYAIRLIAFVIILAGIVHKNRAPRDAEA